MAVAVWTSFQQISDASGNAYSGAKVNVYAAGTVTPLTVYSDTGLSVVAANPIVCDASGQHAMRYIATASYKTTVTTSADASLSSWSKDNIDPGVAVGSGALPIANGGTGSSTAGGARANLGVPSQTEVDDLSTEVADLATQISSLTAVPPGRLTPSSGVPVISSDVSASTNVFYTPYIGDQIPIWNGSAFVITTFVELTLPLVANHLASTFYDCFVINDNGTIRLVTGPAWNTLTAGAGARGTGAGTTEYTRQSGLLVNANAMTGRYGATTVSVAAKAGTYVGSIFIDSAAGQVTCHRSYGQSRKNGIWNLYNQKRVILKVGDSTGTWTYNSATIRQSRADVTNTGAIFVGIQECPVEITFDTTLAAGNGGSTAGACYVGYNSITVASGKQGFINFSSTLPSTEARYATMPTIGLNNANMLESAPVGTPTFNGGESGCLMCIRYDA